MNFPPVKDPIGSTSWITWFKNILFTLNWLTPTFTIPTTVTGTFDLSKLTTVPGNSRLYFSKTMTGNITIVMPQPTNGSTLKVTHVATGGHTISVGGLKTISNGQWVECSSDGTNWFEISFGSL